MSKTKDPIARNAVTLDHELAWVERCIRERMDHHADGRPLPHLLHACPPPPLTRRLGHYARAVKNLKLSPAERLILALALLPHLRPEALDPFLLENTSTRRPFTEWGGSPLPQRPGFLPTGQTALFLLTGGDLEQQLRHRSIFDQDGTLATAGVLRPAAPDLPPFAAPLLLTPDYLELLTTGRAWRPPLGPNFPAQHITTRYDWADLVLTPSAEEDLELIVSWHRHSAFLLQDWGLARRLKPGFRALFYGPPGTGKTLAATLLGRRTGLPVYRVDLSRVVSKYIGETEKNLANLFDHAQTRNWILFFDEADSLFSRRTESRTANDRAANQQVSYLLQRIEDYPGLVLLATNARTFLDDAFSRRFQATVHFAMPPFEQRLRLWQENFEAQPYQLAPNVDLSTLARTYELAGGAILNVLRYACLQAITRTPHLIDQQDLLDGIRKELTKEGKVSPT